MTQMYVISKELDIYIPSKKIAIEFNGVYWHSDEHKPNNYHINKYKECKKHGIQLISIWEDQYITNYEIIKSIILSKLGIYDVKIFARNCKIVKIAAKEAYNFYNKNHLQGKSVAKIHYGLKYNNELVAAMSFGKRAISGSNWELIRYCCKVNTFIVGGASKLFKSFINEFNPDTIISWSCNDISNGNLYLLLGFEFNNESKSYWYIENNTFKRYHRTNFCKKNIIKKKLIDNNLITNISENKIMSKLGKFYKIYDTGQTKWIWRKIN